MVKIYCTKKAEVLFDSIRKDLDTDVECENWNCHLMNFDRKKCLLFVHKETLYCFLLTGVIKRDLQRLPELFIAEFKEQLNYDGLMSPQCEELLKLAYQDFSIFSTNNDKKTLGTLCDYQNHLNAYTVDKVDKLSAAKFLTYKNLNGVLARGRNYRQPRDMMKEKIEKFKPSANSR